MRITKLRAHTLDTLISKATFLLAKYVRNERRESIPRVAGLQVNQIDRNP